MSSAAAETVVAVARSSYAQLLAYVAARADGDVAQAEDALSDAFLAALRQWPDEGVPAKPEAWLLHTARRRLLDAWRRGETRLRAQDELVAALTAAQTVAETGHDFPDDRLKLLFVCAHPAIDSACRAPLSLQVVLGLEAERIASAFLVSPAAMSQRLVRAKAKIRAARIPFQIPSSAEWPERLEFVLDAVYVAFNAGWDTTCDPAAGGRELAEEAIALGRLLVALCPGEPEPLGLLALMLHCHARREARRSPDGAFVPLGEQETTRWQQPLIAEAEGLIRQAAGLGRPGRYQWEAAIQSVHAARAVTGRTEWRAVAGLYEALLRFTPALGARIGHAVALGEAAGPTEGLRALDALDPEMVRSHQPYWVARAHLLERSGRHAEAHAALQRAIGLTDDPAVRRFLLRRAQAE